MPFLIKITWVVTVFNRNLLCNFLFIYLCTWSASVREMLLVLLIICNICNIFSTLQQGANEPTRSDNDNRSTCNFQHKNSLQVRRETQNTQEHLATISHAESPFNNSKTVSSFGQQFRFSHCVGWYFVQKCCTLQMVFNQHITRLRLMRCQLWPSFRIFFF